MYHHRYQPPTNLANKTAAAFASPNYPNSNSHPSALATSSATRNSTSRNQQYHSATVPNVHKANNSNNFIYNHHHHHQQQHHQQQQHHHHHHRHHHHNQISNNSSSASYSYAPTNRSAEDRQDVIFRKVRGILNKITPETFDKLSKELVNVGLDSPRTLRGVIYLLFDKALKDLKYSSLYAKLCQELSEKAPNFEVEPGPNTFCKFLISKCEDEFERRRRATEDFDRKNDLTDEEYEQRAIAKQKMLGNIKFICELGKKRLLQEEILHECIRGLLSKKKERSIQDQAQDLECLCQIMRTIGSLLDIQASRNLMNQYFERIDMFSKKPELPSRIRFMLRDVIDLRNNNWRPRPFQREDNVPQPLSKLREEAGYDPTVSSSIDKFGNNRNLLGMSDLSKLHGDKLSLLLDDEPSFTTSTDFHWGPSFLSLDNPFDPFSTGNAPNKPAQKPAAAPTSIKSDSSSQSNTQSTQKFPNFRAHDPFPEHAGDRRLDPRPNYARNNTVNQQRPGNDFGEFKDKPNINFRQCAIDPKNDIEPTSIERSRQSGFATYNPPKMPRGDHISHDESRRYMDTKSGQQVDRSQTVQQHNRPIPRRQESRDFGPPPLPSHDGHHSANFSQNRSNNRHDEARNNTHGPNVHNSRERRPFNQNNYQEQNSRFSNNYRPARSERVPRARENFQFDRSNNESDTSQNWRAGPPSSASSVTSKHSSNPTPSIDCPPIQRPKPSLSETDGQERQKFDRARNSKSPTGPNSTSPTRYVSMQPRAIDRNKPIVTREIADSTPRSLIDRNDDGPQLMYEPQAHHINRPISRHADLGRIPHVERRLNISPPRPRILESGSRHQHAQQNSGRPVHINARQNPRPGPSDTSETLDPSQGPHCKIVHSSPFDSKNQSLVKSKISNDMDSPVIDRKVYPLSRSNNPSISSDIQDPDRVSNWRKGSGLKTAPQSTVKTPTKDAVKPQLNTSILPRPLPKISDTNFSLRPSHNLISAQASIGVSKPTPIVDNNAPLPINIAQASFEASKVTTSESGIEKLATNGAIGKEIHSKSARDFHVNKFISAMSEHSNEENCNLNRIVSKVKELKIPKNYQSDCLVSAMRVSIFKTEVDRENAKKLIAQLLPGTFESVALLNAFKITFEQLQALEAEVPRVKSLVAGFLSQAILDNLLSLEEVGGVLSGGRHHPLFLLCLQKLENSAGQAWLNDKFLDSKIDLMAMLPEVDRSKDRLASVLKDRCLGFLDPMLTIEPDLWEQMKDKDSSPAAIYHWIKDNINSTIQGTPTFAHVLVTCLARYVHSTSAEKIKSSEVVGEKQNEENPQSNKSSPSSASQGTADIEKELLSKYQQMLQAILKDKPMQLATLYSLQSFYHGLDFPKGALLRWFHQMYDLNIVDDDVFFIWKEEINDKFPGKGQALFQVNTWLNWLAEAESEEEEEV